MRMPRGRWCGLLSYCQRGRESASRCEWRPRPRQARRSRQVLRRRRTPPGQQVPRSEEAPRGQQAPRSGEAPRGQRAPPSEEALRGQRAPRSGEALRGQQAPPSEEAPRGQQAPRTPANIAEPPKPLRVGREDRVQRRRTERASPHDGGRRGTRSRDCQPRRHERAPASTLLRLAQISNHAPYQRECRLGLLRRETFQKSVLALTYDGVEIVE